ncbi:MAG: PorV/PorQ family protein [Bacteroidetes bacterium]|nr:MAG: PorV/PorQ family protein [Bacteroidota bacterium]
MKRSVWFTGIMLIMSISLLPGQKYSNEFLAIGVGAQAHGMAGAQTAHVADITAAYWNPAGLTEIDAPFQVAAMHAEWFVGVSQYDYLSFGKALNRDQRSYLAISLIRLGIDNIPYTINLVNPDGTVNYDNVTSFSAADYALMGSYARKLRNPAFAVGGSVKVIRRVIGSFGGAWGFGADMGVQYRKGRWMLGIQGRDLTTTFNAWSFDLTEREKEVFTQTNNEIPTSSTEITRPRFILGAAYRARVGEKTTLLPAIDLEWTTDGQRNVLIHSSAINIDPRIGIEADYNKLVQLRIGVGNFQRVRDDFDPDKETLTLQPNFGVGLRLGRVQLDYALTDIGNLSQVLYSHIFSVRVDFRQRNRPVSPGTDM